MGRDKGRQVLLSDVASHAGVSTAVVSYVLNNGPRPVAAETRDKVLASISTLSYRPNRVARSLASNRTSTLGLIVPDTTNAFFSDLVRHTEAHAFSRGLLTLIGNADLDHRHEDAYVEAFLGANVDGLIIASTDLTKLPSSIGDSNVVFVHRRPRGSRHMLIRADDRSGALSLTESLIAAGHKHIACVAGPELSGPIHDRVKGWQDALRAHDFPVTQPGIRCNYHRQETAQQTIELLSREPIPDAIFACTDEQAIGVLAAAARMGIRVPDDLTVVGFDGVSAAATTVPRLTTVAVPIKDMAAAAVDLVSTGQTPHGKPRANNRWVFPTEILIADSHKRAERS